MILIRPLIRANAARLHNVHVVVFFIFLVGNIGGALSPLGDPPLFIGFLNGVDFFWPLQNLWQPTAFVAGCVLAIFVAVDLWFYRKDRRVAPVGEASAPLRVHGVVNLALLAVIIGAVIVSALWKPGDHVHGLRHGAAVAGSAARRRAVSHRARLAVADARRAPRGQRFLLGADRRSGDPVRGDFRLRRADSGDARSRP